MSDISKHHLRMLFDAAVYAADPIRSVPANLPEKPKGRVVIIGAGKASARMAEALEAHWGPCEGLVITRYGYARPTCGIEIVEAAHPVPDEAGLNATARILDMVSDLSEDDFVVALMSGGGSALLSLPADGMSFADKQAVHQALLQSGAPIGDMNIVRKHLSKIKGGGLARACMPARVLTLMISDVAGDDPQDIASGPTVRDDTTSAQARGIVARYDMQLPRSAVDVLAAPEMACEDEFTHVENRIIAASMQSLRAAKQLALTWGWAVKILGDDIEGEAKEVALIQANMALKMQSKMDSGGEPTLLLSGGECTVSHRGTGIGGPNAEFTLAMAIALEGRAGISVLACDTDGVDGAAEVAGAFADGTTVGRARSLGIDPAEALEVHDSHGFFDALDDQIVTGPTLTNVNDFRAILIEPL
ncbi:MAG: glycerate kinase type-2 family protein [Halocynthiibacter sp.]